MRTIYYLGAYRSEHVKERLPQGSSAEDYKMTYVIDSLKKAGCRVIVISVLASLKSGFHPRETVCVDEKETHIYLSSIDSTRPILCSLSALLRLIGLFWFLLSHLKGSDTLFVYNTQLFSAPIRLAKRLRHFKLILEIEEIFYKEARSAKDVAREPLERKLICSADGYLAINERVRREYCDPKPTVISYGSYFIPPCAVQRYNDGRVHLVYAGIVNSTHGAHQALEMMRYLDSSYFLHIYGFGQDAELRRLEQKVQEINSAKGLEQVRFHGSKAGAEFDACLQQCHVGLNFNILLHSDSGTFAYPSKIPSYLCHGLNVLTYRIPSVEQSRFNSFVNYFDSSDSALIAEAVRRIPINDYRTQVAIMSQFDVDFVAEMKELLARL